MSIVKAANLRKISLCFILLCLSFKSIADPLLNGIAIHTELNKEQFIAALYTDTLSYSSEDILLADENKRMEVRIFTNKLLSNRFKRLWIEGMAVNSSRYELEQQANNMAYFSNLLKVKLAAGDVFSVERSMSTGTKIFLNNILLGTIKDNSFFDLLLRTWIGPVPLSSDFRTNLLSQGNINENELIRLESITPSNERIAKIKNIFASKVSAPDMAILQEEEAASTTSPSSIVEAQSTTSSSPKTKIDNPDEEEYTAASVLSRQLYLVSLKHWSNKFLKYPKDALARDREGSVRLDVTLDRSGAVKKIEAAKAAEYTSLTRAAIRAINRADPFPPVPEKIKGEEFIFTLPILFVIKNK